MTARRIRAWFLERNGDGEFVCGDRARPYSVSGTPDGAGCVIFTTKPAAVSAVIEHAGDAFHCGMVGRYGLPDDAALSWIRKLIGRRPLTFLGDLDPVDLLVFAWLRAKLRSTPVIHLGINEAFLKALGRVSVGRLTIPLAPSEQESLPFLKETLPELFFTIGPTCAKLLERGRKVELDIIGDRRDKTATALQSLLASAQAQSDLPKRNKKRR